MIYLSPPRTCGINSRFLQGSEETWETEVVLLSLYFHGTLGRSLGSDSRNVARYKKGRLNENLSPASHLENDKFHAENKHTAPESKPDGGSS